MPRRPHANGAIALRRNLIAWWRANGRSLPWRGTRQPYRVLMAEVMLQRTRAEQVAPLFQQFVRTFPSWRHVAALPLGELRRILRPIGLRWRITMIHRMAKEIATRFGGRTPRGRSELESLPGVGHYKASAVRCFAYGHPEVLLDTNTVRVLSRIRGLRRSDASRRSKLYRDELSRLLDRRCPREFNFAMLDLAALVCHPSNPDCERCPVWKQCAYGTRYVRSRTS